MIIGGLRKVGYKAKIKRENVERVYQIKMETECQERESENVKWLKKWVEIWREKIEKDMVNESTIRKWRNKKWCGVHRQIRDKLHIYNRRGKVQE